MNFHASNDIICPHCQEMLNTAAAFGPDDKPMDGHYTICVFCAGVCIYVIQEGVVSLRSPTEEEIGHAKETGFWHSIEEMVDFVKSKPKR